MRYGIYFNTQNQSIQLPVNPEELTVNYAGDNTDYNLIDKGEVIIPRHPKLATVEISSFFPRNSYNGLTVSNSWNRPEDYVRFFKSLQEKRMVFQFIVSRYDVDVKMFDTSFYAVISDFSITDKGGEAGDVYYSLTVSEYRDTAPQRVDKVSESETTTVLATTDIRLVPNDEFVVGDKVTVSGPIYDADDQPQVVINQTLTYASNVSGIVGRVLPPSLIPDQDRLYVKGVGWVQKADCVKGNARNTANKARLLGGNNA